MNRPSVHTCTKPVNPVTEPHFFLKSGSLERFKARSHEDPVSHFTVTKGTCLRRTTDTLKPLNGHLRSTLCREKISQNENVGALLAHDSKLSFFFCSFCSLASDRSQSM